MRSQGGRHKVQTWRSDSGIREKSWRRVKWRRDWWGPGRSQGVREVAAGEQQAELGAQRTGATSGGGVFSPGDTG